MTAIADRRSGAIRTRHRPAAPGAPFVPDLEKGEPGGVATLDSGTALVPNAQLASSGVPSASTALRGDRSWGAVATAADITSAISTHVGTSDPHTQYQRESEKGVASGYASLDGSGVVPDAQIPAAIARDAEVTAAIAAHAALTDPHPGRTASWTPVLGGLGGESGQTYTRQVGRVVRYGRLFVARGHVLLSAKGTITSSLRIKGFPYAQTNTTGVYGLGYVTYFGNLGAGWISLNLVMEPGAQVADIYGAAAAVTTSQLLATADITNTTTMSFLLIGETDDA